MDLFKGTCQEFAKVFTQDLASLDDIDDKVQHHAEALTNCLKLVQSNPQSLAVQQLWMSLLRSALKFLLQIEPSASKTSLKLFLDTIKPWLINENFSGLCCKELKDMYNLVQKGPWSQPALQKLISGTEVGQEEMLKVFDDGLEFIEHHMRTLFMSSKTTQLISFGHAALAHPQVGKNKSVQKLYQSYLSDIMTEADLYKHMNHFDFEVTVELLYESIENKVNCRNLCFAALKYLLQNEKMKHLEEVMSCWIKILQIRYRGPKLFEYLTEHIIESSSLVNSVQQCVAVVRALWTVVAEPSRMMCVEILWHALQLLTSDQPDSDQLRKGILSSIAYFLPNSQVSRSCVLTIFILHPTVDHYFEVGKTYRVPYDRDKDTANDCKAHLRLNLLEYLQQQWPQEFHQSSSWDWPLLRTACQKMLNSSDLEHVQLEEKTEESKEANSCETGVEPSDVYMREDVVLDARIERIIESKCSTHAPTESEKQSAEVGSSNACDPCDCIACMIRQNKQVPGQTLSNDDKKQKVAGSKPSSACMAKSQAKKDPVDDYYYVCPEESCQRAYRSKIGMSKHLSKVHQWSMSEVHGFYTTVNKVYIPAGAQSKHMSRSSPTKKTPAESKVKPSRTASDGTLSQPHVGDEALSEPLLSTRNEPGSDLQQATVLSNVISADISHDLDPEIADAGTEFELGQDDHADPDTSKPNSDSPSSLSAEKSVFSATTEQLNAAQEVIPDSSTIQGDVSRAETIQAEPSVSDVNCEPLPARGDLMDQTSEISQSVAKDDSSYDRTNDSSIIDEPVARAPSSVPSLPSIFPSRNEIEEEVVDEVAEEQSKQQEMNISCPVCSRAFKHRHTVQEHIEFRHKISPEKAEEMAKSAKHTDVEPSSTASATSNAVSQSKPSDIRHSRGWYWPVDDFIGKENDSFVRHHKVIDHNLKFSIEFDVMRTLGRTPRLFNCTTAATDIISNWKLAKKYNKKTFQITLASDDEEPAIEQPSNVPNVSLSPPTTSQVSAPLRKEREVATLGISSTVPRSSISERVKTAKFKRDSRLSSGGSKEVADSVKSVSKSPNDSDVVPIDPISSTRDSYSQTNFKTSGPFSKTDHFHNLPSVKSLKLKRSKKDDYPIARTVITGIYVKHQTQTLACQCCQNELKKVMWPSANSKSTSMPSKKRKSTEDDFTKALFSSNGDDPWPPSKVKRKYDMQTVYHLADSPGNTKPSFGDALNSAAATVVRTHSAEKNKTKRKHSKSFESEDVEEFHSFPKQKPRLSASVSYSSASQSKKSKPKKPRSSRGVSSTVVKKHLIADVVVKKRDDDLTRQLFPTHDYEELLKHAEELNSVSKPKTPKTLKLLSVLPSANPPLSNNAVSNKPVAVRQSVGKIVPVKLEPVVESHVTSPAPDEASVNESQRKKAACGKRRIDLRKLSSASKHKPSAASTADQSESSHDDNYSNSEQDSFGVLTNEQGSSLTGYSSPPESTDAISSPPLSLQSLSTPIVETADVVCPICSKPLLSDFALACHMRKRHKVRSKKVFIPGQTYDAALDSSSSSVGSKKSAKHSKNAQEPPEGREASSENAATFRLAPNKLNASCFSSTTSSDEDISTTSNIYNADESALAESVVPANESLSSDVDTLTEPLENQRTGSIAGEVDSTSHNARRFHVPTGEKPDPASTSTPVQSAPIADDVSNVSCESARHFPINLNDGRYHCPVDCCSSNYAHYKSIRSHCKNKHGAVFEKMSEMKGKQLARKEQSQSSSPSLKERKRSLSTNNALQPVRKPSVNVPTVKPQKLKSNFRNGRYYCYIKGCPTHYKYERDIKRHCREKHPKFFAKKWGIYVVSRRSRSHESAPARKSKSSCPVEGCAFESFRTSSLKHHCVRLHLDLVNKATSLDAFVSRAEGVTSCATESSDEEMTQNDDVISSFQEGSVRRNAYIEASSQIQLSAVSLSPGKWSQHRELMRLYNKRVKRKVAHALTPAERQLTTSKLFKKRRDRTESNDSTDSYEADYDAQLPCWYCQEMFHCRRNLAKHIEFHIRKVASFLHRCDYFGCLYGFKSKLDLQLHEQVHKKKNPHVCLFCPNQSRCFRSHRKMLIHEQFVHTHVKTNMEWLRRTHCAGRYVLTVALPSKQESSSIKEEEPFLAPGHRRTMEIARNDVEPSVACDRLIGVEVLHMINDVVGVVLEYEEIAREKKRVKTVVTSPNGPISIGEVSVVCNRLSTVRDLCLKAGVHLAGAEKRGRSPEKSEEPVVEKSTDSRDRVVESCNETSAQLLATDAISSGPADETSNVASAPKQSSSDQLEIAPDEDVIGEATGSDLNSVPSEFQRYDSLSIDVTVPEANFTGSASARSLSHPDFEVALEVVQTVHKLVCDVEIEEQASFMRKCGYVPTGVMYFKQGDLLESPGVALSVYGCNSEAFVLLDMAESSSTAPNFPGISNPIVPHSIGFNPNPFYPVPSSVESPMVDSAAVESPSSSNSLEVGVYGASWKPTDVDLTGAAGSLATFSPLLAMSAYQALLHTKLWNSYMLQTHPIWSLDADQSTSDICDVMPIDPISKKLFCRHYVVPSPSLKLPATPLTGICTSYPVMTDAPRHEAFMSMERSEGHLVPRQFDAHETSANSTTLSNTSSVTCHIAESSKSYDESQGQRSNACEVSLQTTDLGCAKEVVARDGCDDDPATQKEQEGEGGEEGEGGQAVTNPFFDDLMKEIQVKKISRSKKCFIAKPPVIFPGRGRPQKSFDMVHSRSSQRRSLSEIVAFCDLPTTKDALKQKQVTQVKQGRGQKKVDQGLIEENHPDSGSQEELNSDSKRSIEDVEPAVKLSRRISFKRKLTRASEANLRKMKKKIEKRIKSKLLRSKKARRSVRTAIARDKITKLSDVKENQSSSSVATTPSENFASQSSTSNHATTSQDSSSCILQDHSYALSRSSESVNASSSDIFANGCKDVEISDYCEVVSIDVSGADDGKKSSGSQIDLTSSVLTSADSIVSSIPATTDDVSEGATKSVSSNSSYQPCTVDTMHREESHDLADLSELHPRLIPCLFCTSWFASVSACKKHFRKAHVGSTRKEMKRSPNLQLQTNKLLANARKQLIKSNIKKSFQSVNTQPPVSRSNNVKPIAVTLKQTLLNQNKFSDHNLTASCTQGTISMNIGDKNVVIPLSDIPHTARFKDVAATSVLSPIAPKSKGVSNPHIAKLPLTSGKLISVQTPRLWPNSSVSSHRCNFSVNPSSKSTPQITPTLKPIVISGSSSLAYHVPLSVCQAIDSRMQVEVNRFRVANANSSVLNQTFTKSLAIVTPTFRSGGVVGANSAAARHKQVSSGASSARSDILPLPMPLLRKLPSSSVSSSIETARLQSRINNGSTSLPLSLTLAIPTTTQLVKKPTRSDVVASSLSSCTNIRKGPLFTTGRSSSATSSNLKFVSKISSTALSTTLSPSNSQRSSSTKLDPLLRNVKTPLDSNSLKTSSISVSPPILSGLSGTCDPVRSIKNLPKNLTAFLTASSTKLPSSSSSNLHHTSLSRNLCRHPQVTNHVPAGTLSSPPVSCQVAATNRDASSSERGQMKKENFSPANSTGNFHPAPGCKVTSPGCKVTSPGCKVTSSGCQVTSPGCKVTSPGCQVIAPGCKVIAPGCKVASPGCEVAAPGCKVTSPRCEVAAPGCQVTTPGCKVTTPGCKVAQTSLSSLRLFQCRCCSSAYPDVYDYKMHMFLVHSLHMCPFINCNELFNSEKELEEHARIQHGRTIKLRKNKSTYELLPISDCSKINEIKSEQLLEQSISTYDTQSEKENDVDVGSDVESLLKTPLEMWNAKIPSHLKKKCRSKLLSGDPLLSEKQLQCLVRLEVRILAKQSHIMYQFDNTPFMRCPIGNCYVSSDKKQNLFNHLLDKHNHNEIISFIRQRDADQRRRQKQASNSRTLQKRAVARLLRQKFNKWRDAHRLASQSSSRDHTSPPVSTPERSYCSDENPISCGSRTPDGSFKCRFMECGKTIGGQTNFAYHMLSHSPSRIAWHEEKGRMWPLFNPVVIVSRSATPSISSVQGEVGFNSPRNCDELTNLSTPSSLIKEEQELIDIGAGSMGAQVDGRPLSSDSSGQESSKTPLVVLKKLSSTFDNKNG